MSVIFNHVILVIYYIIIWIKNNLIIVTYYIINNNKLYVSLYYLFMFLSFILIFIINMPTAGKDDLEYLLKDNTTCSNNRLDLLHADNVWEWWYEPTTYPSNSLCQLSGNDDWEKYFPSNSKGYTDLLFADKNSITNMFRGNTSLSANNVMDKTECNNCFQNTISSVVTKRLTYFDRTKYTVEDTVASTRFEALYKGIISTKASNNSLDLNWRELCRLYAMTHHIRTPFDIHEIKSYTPETFYNHLETSHKNKPLCLHWQWPLDKYSTKKNELYAYMRIVEFSMKNK